MSFSDLPASAAWRHSVSREGYEAVFFKVDHAGYRLDGHTVATEGGRPWVVRYAITLNDESSRQRYDYEAPAFEFRAVLVYDESGLVLEYPGIGSRVL